MVNQIITKPLPLQDNTDKCGYEPMIQILGQVEKHDKV